MMQILNTTIRRNDAMIVRQVFLGEALEMKEANRFHLLAVQTDVVHHNRVQAGRDDGDRRLLVCSVHDTVPLFAGSPVYKSEEIGYVVVDNGFRSPVRSPIEGTIKRLVVRVGVEH